MSLFTDGLISTIADLTAYDSSLLDVASTEGIDVTRKLGLAQDEVATVLITLLPQGADAGLSNLVVTTPLRLWHIFQTLALVYEDAYYSQLNDRYQGKWKMYADRARWAKEKLMQAGAGFVSDPIAQAQPPVLVEVPGNRPAATYFVAAAWVNESGAEGAPSQSRSLSAAVGNSIRVTPAAAPTNAAGWNVYAGYGSDDMSLQTDTPLDPSQSWTFTDPELAAGRAPGSGQLPDFLRALPRLLQRG
jgi:hypothetical protein